MQREDARRDARIARQKEQLGLGPRKSGRR
jgi:hypothetical protein